MIDPTSLTSITPTVSTYAPIETTTCNQQELLDRAESIVTAFINDLSFVILNPAGQSSAVTSSLSLTASVGLLLATMGLDDMARILDIPPGKLTDKFAREIHKVMGGFSRKNSFESAGYEKKLVSTLNLLASRNNLRSDDELVEVLSTHYLAKILTPEGNESVADMTNEHLKVATGGLIPALLKDGTHSIKTTLTNVMVFNVGWKKELAKGTGLFMKADGVTVGVETMTTTDKMGLMIDPKRGLAAIALPFEQREEQLYLVAIAPLQPSPGAIDRIESSEDLNHLINRALDSQNKEQVKLTLPQIRINSTNSELLEQIGSLRGIEITPEMLEKLDGQFCGDISTIQTTIAEIDEKGARGAVATVTSVTREGAKNEPFEFNFNSPGLVIIADEKGNRVLEAAIKDDEYLVASDEPVIIEGAGASISVATRKILRRRCRRCGEAQHGICIKGLGSDFRAKFMKRLRQLAGREESPVKNIPSTSGQPSGGQPNIPSTSGQPSGNLPNIPSTPKKSFDDLTTKNKENQLLKALEEKFNVPVKNVELGQFALDITTDTKKEADAIVRRINRFIGQEHKDSVRITDFSYIKADPRFEVRLTSNARSILIDKLFPKNRE
ncbi:serpin family protein [Endozoicomonas sp. ONNA2]|uniref:serpin family protein n=1 Tax=Endozoicomonas sp. ONNA2 TaxID=2828741 RepID=UPI002148D595|nr:serpin family protein [Endozoicomonas sp. ONNA2]